MNRNNSPRTTSKAYNILYIEALHGLYWFCLFQLSIGEICWDCWFQSIFLECLIFFPKKPSNLCNNGILSTLTEYCYGLSVSKNIFMMCKTNACVQIEICEKAQEQVALTGLISFTIIMSRITTFLRIGLEIWCVYTYQREER